MKRKPIATGPLPMTVPEGLHAAVAQATSPAFASSYLSGAALNEKVLRPRTVFARDRIAESRAAMRILAEDYITLGKPLAPHERQPIVGFPA